MRYKEGDIYKLNEKGLRSQEFNKLVNNYENLIAEILEAKKKGIDFSGLVLKVKKLREKLINNGYNGNIKNVLKYSRLSDKMIGYGQDSLVYNFQNIDNYIYKEGKESNVNNYKYLKNKYLILKTYLGDMIPKSYFILGESSKNNFKKRGIDINYISTKIITIQKKIKGKDTSKMSLEEKNNKKFLNKLEKAHRKYILLKYFLKSIIEELNLDKKSMDLQLDLGKLSKKDEFHSDKIEFIDKEINSPNIMYDQDKVYFIDFGYGTWDKNKQKIFNKLMEKETINKWKQILNSYGLE